ncbi:16S rRNA methyltransferase [Pseudidiomarina aestuarii]|uniref:Ribosomal RNA small subunit methyltransferase J n=1 Tax=Pseudidiomarina aestuarii TaxID=624146 RepID=A0A7Z6ZRV4_9GAMM|nr:class I SAM-dependent methyltransferase [Pseudidiomarina aestuarii]RUO38978.1 16S rRNA methyltransferase [Pseudidiomarina aestuarii]
MSADFKLEPTPQGLALRWLTEPKMLPLRIDFCAGEHAARAARASIKQEAIARACGMHKRKQLHILDGTAGLGRDALVLAALGATVGLNERQPEVAALLQDALERLTHCDPDLAQRLYFAGSDCFSATYKPRDPFDVVYLDPMYPKGDKAQRAAVKKDMQMFQQLVGIDQDADDLLAPALVIATQRVVVKRPQHANFLGGRKPTHQIISKKHRFDVYLTTTTPAM